MTGGFLAYHRAMRIPFGLAMAFIAAPAAAQISGSVSAPDS